MVEAHFMIHDDAIVLLCFLALPFLAVGASLMLKKRVKACFIILGVYPALIGSFVIYGHFERRSTVGHIARWFEGEDGAHQDVNDLAEDAKKVVDPSQLQQWAMTVLQQTETTNYTPDGFPRDKVLTSIRNLQGGGRSFETVTVDTADSLPPQSRTVWICWVGDAFAPIGHWGIRVGYPTFKANDQYDDNYYVEWKPGIYFWCETH